MNDNLKKVKKADAQSTAIVGRGPIRMRKGGERKTTPGGFKGISRKSLQGKKGNERFVRSTVLFIIGEE